MYKINKLLLVNILFNGLNFLVLTIFLKKLSVIGITLLALVSPIIINGITDYLFFLNPNERKSAINYLLPIVSVIGYFIFGWVTLQNGAWNLFTNQYKANSYIQISDNPIDFTALFFIIIIYFSIQFLIVELIKRRRD